jgi:hypothetical protein
MTWTRRDKLRLVRDVGLLTIGLVLVAIDFVSDWRASRLAPNQIPPDMPPGPTVNDPVLASLENAPEDDEPLSEADAKELDDAAQEFA